MPGPFHLCELRVGQFGHIARVDLIVGHRGEAFEVVLMCFRQRRERIVCMFNRRHIASFLYALRDEPK